MCSFKFDKENGYCEVLVDSIIDSDEFCRDFEELVGDIALFFRGGREEYEIYWDYHKSQDFKKKLSSLYSFLKENINFHNLRSCSGIKYFMDFYENWDTEIEKINKEYVEEEIKRSKKLFDELNLNHDQRVAVVTDEDSTQVIASAGTGKTRTIVAKVKYLIERKGVAPHDILCLSYSRGSTDDLDERIKSVGIPTCYRLEENRVRVTTFHSFGYSFIENHGAVISSERKKDQKPEHNTNYIINQYFIDRICDDVSVLQDLKRYFYDDFRENMHSDSMDDGSTIKKILYSRTPYDGHSFDALDMGHVVDCFVDLQIADFLTLNGIDYYYHEEYDKDYLDGRKLLSDFYLPKEGIYIENYCVDKNGVPLWLKKEDRLKYIDQYNFKRNFCDENGLKFLTINTYTDDGFLDSLEKALRDFNVEFHPLMKEEIIGLLDKYEFEMRLTDFRETIVDFVQSFKEHNFPISKFDDFKKAAASERELSALEMIEDYYIYYDDYLNISSHKYVDFPDMIIKGAKSLKNTHLKYVLVDEYQDMSEIRFTLLKKLREDSRHSKMMVVGDDWQSIYGFNGCDVKYFSQFNQYFPHSKQVHLNQTYRFSNKLIKATSDFVNDDGLINKGLYSEIESREEPIKLVFSRNAFVTENKKVYDILRHISETSRNRDVMILSRYNDKLNDLEKQLKLIHAKENLGFNKLEFKSFHRAKGLESGNVILIDINSEKAKGVPSKIEDKGLLRFVSFKNMEYQLREEKRLFYVAMTRTKDQVYISCLKEKMSPYISDLNKDSIKQFLYNPRKDYNPFSLNTINVLKYYWHHRRFVRELNTSCPRCGNKLKEFEINGKFYIVCGDCGFYVNDKFSKENAADKIYICDVCGNDIVYPKAGKIKCSNPRCPNSRQKKTKTSVNPKSIKPRRCHDFISFNNTIRSPEDSFKDVNYDLSKTNVSKKDSSKHDLIMENSISEKLSGIHMGTIKCPHCELKNNIINSSCDYCGYDFKNPQHNKDRISCPNCRCLNDANQKACSNCGFKLAPKKSGKTKKGIWKKIDGISSKDKTFSRLKLDSMTLSGDKLSSSYLKMLEKYAMDDNGEEIRDGMIKMIEGGYVERGNERQALIKFIKEYSK